MKKTLITFIVILIVLTGCQKKAVNSYVNGTVWFLNQSGETISRLDYTHIHNGKSVTVFQTFHWGGFLGNGKSEQLYNGFQECDWFWGGDKVKVNYMLYPSNESKYMEGIVNGDITIVGH